MTEETSLRKNFHQENSSNWFGEILECKECVPNFDGRGGWKFCKKHWKDLKNQRWEKVE